MDWKEFNTYAKNTWCPGCGNFAIELAVKQVFAELVNEGVVERENIVILSGIGCHAKISDYINVNSFYSLHGRVAAPATGIKLANPDLLVVGFAGDGDAYGEGLEHLIFAAKRNSDITMIIHNNRLYALTTGQFAPTSPANFLGRSTPKGAPEDPMNPIKLMLASGASFVARTFTGNIAHMKKIFREAFLHRGFAIVDVLQPCITFLNTYDFYRERVYDLQEEGHDAGDFEQAMKKAEEWNYTDGESERIPVGIFYRVEKPTFEERVLKGEKLCELEIPSIKELLERHK